MATTEYITRANFKTYAGVEETTWDAIIDSTIVAACRSIDTFCGRRFYIDDAVSTRRFKTSRSGMIRVDDIGTVTGLIVAVDTGDTGTFDQTWAATDYELAPVNGQRDGRAWPYTEIHGVGNYDFPTDGRRSRVQVTAKWGWAAVPEQVVHAAYVLTQDLFKGRDNVFGIVGSAEYGVLRIRTNPVMSGLLNAFTRPVVA